MAHVIETRREMLASFFFMANDEQRAQAKIQEIMSRNRVQRLSPAIQQALMTAMGHLASAEPTSWKLFDWFTRNMTMILASFEAMMQNPTQDVQRFNDYMRQFGEIDVENPPEIDMAMVPQSLADVNARAESLITLTENIAVILKNMPQQIARPNIDGMTVEQVSAWVNENANYLTSSRWEQLNPVYEYGNGWRMIHLTDDRDFQRAGKELGNCIRHSPPPEGGGFLGHPGIFVMIDENEKPLAALRMGSHGGRDMYICFDAKAFDSQNAQQIEAEQYKEYIDEFLKNTTPSEIYGEEVEQQWEAMPNWLSRVASHYLHIHHI